MQIQVNNQPKEIPRSSSLLVLLQDLAMNESKGIAVAINNKVVKRADWPTTQLSEEDKITIIKATQGG